MSEAAVGCVVRWLGVVGVGIVGGGGAVWVGSASDTIDILHTRLYLRIDPSVDSIVGSATLTVRLCQPASAITLHLEALSVDSVSEGGALLAFSHLGPLLRVWLGSPRPAGDTLSLTVWYRGMPARDALWGGFYFQPPYAYNVGVGFAAVPHSFGRAWFPTVDTFSERFTVSISVEVPVGYAAYCSGILEDTQVVAGAVVWRWRLDVPVPAYLVSVAVAPYQRLTDTFVSVSGAVVPVVLSALAQDTARLRTSFVHLRDAFHIFEGLFGEHRFPRIGYNLVPFTGGAMEHPTNITYSRLLADGTLRYETVMAHELSHHWWGDLVTTCCASQMWLNEGAATWSELLFVRGLYGDSAFSVLLADFWDRTLRLAHIEDGGYWALDSVPQQYTYGLTSYLRGALAFHTIYNWMEMVGGAGTAPRCIRQFMDSFAFRSVNSELLFAFLQGCLSALNPEVAGIPTPRGWLASAAAQPVIAVADAAAGSVVVQVQWRNGSPPGEPAIIPLSLLIKTSNATLRRSVLLTTDSCQRILLPELTEVPRAVILNPDNEFFSACYAYSVPLTVTDTLSLGAVYADVYISTTYPDTLYLRHCFGVPPARTTYTFVGERPFVRWWSVAWAGAYDTLVGVGIKFYYQKGAAGTYPHLDYATPVDEASLTLYYRKPYTDWWLPWADYISQKGTLTDQRGALIAYDIARGDYLLVQADTSSVVVRAPARCTAVSPLWIVQLVDVPVCAGGCYLRVYSVAGQLLQEAQAGSEAQLRKLVEQWRESLPTGIYLLQVKGRVSQDMVSELLSVP